MRELAVVALIAVFFLGLVLVGRAIVGKEVSETWLMSQVHTPDHPGPAHPPEQHRLRLALAGLACMLAAVGGIAVLMS